MIVLGIVGHPVAHSKSPLMHGAAMAHVGIEGVYLRFDVLPEDLASAIAGARALGIHGLNVTVPYKESVMACLDEVDDVARGIGAVNTIVRDGRRLVGTNTDAEGLARSLDEAGVPLGGARVVVVGGGGAARAAVVGLAKRGASRITVAARRPEQADDLVRSLGRMPCSLDALAIDALGPALADTTLLVQSTSATLTGNPDASAFAAALPLERLPKGAAVVDLVYKPRETAVLARARALELVAVDGLGMLLHQGALAFERWTGRTAPVDVMRAALESA